MPIRTAALALLAALWLPLPLLAQSADTDIASVVQSGNVTEEQQSEQDVGTLQAELAKVEAERQALEEELANDTSAAQLEQANEQNLVLRDRLAAMEEVADHLRKDEQRKWFIVGGSTVAISLLVGWLLARLGGGRKRSMWLN